MEVKIEDLLGYIPASACSYAEWSAVGMALKHEGYDVEVWDRWSQSDSRYKQGECFRKWESFKERAGSIVTGGTIYELARRFGYSPSGKGQVRCFAWDDEIEYDGEPRLIKDAGWIEQEDAIEAPKDDEWDPIGELQRYLEALFKPTDIIGWCVDSRLDEERGKWLPSSSGVYNMSVKRALASLKKYEKIEWTIGDYNKAAGAWIRFNPLDGKGARNENVAEYRYALVESDSISIERQKALMEAMKLPIAAMVTSGGKSIHAIVRIGAQTEKEYRERVDYLYRICDKNGLTVDTQNKNASRLSRMPGVWRGDHKQYLIATNIGMKSFEEWRDMIEEEADSLPDVEYIDPDVALPPLAPELIEGILRRGHKMLIAGPSKAGKSFMLIELGLAIATGREWLDFRCKQGKVLYVNLEVDPNSFMHRVSETAARLGFGKDWAKNFGILNFRGLHVTVERLAQKLARMKKHGDRWDAIIIDPLYKINEGDENSAAEMGRFFSFLDEICKTMGASVILCHHHSKGAQGAKFAMDRASGSGVFARDPDALLDMIQLDPEDVEGLELPLHATAWRISYTLREFATPDPTDVIFEYPTHSICYELGEAEPLTGASREVQRERGLNTIQKNRDKRIARFEQFVGNWDSIRMPDNPNKYPTIQDAVEYFQHDKGYSSRTIRRWIKDGVTSVNYFGTDQIRIFDGGDEEG